VPDLVCDYDCGSKGAGSNIGLSEEAEILLGYGGIEGGEASQLLNNLVLSGNSSFEGGFLGHGDGQVRGRGRGSEHVNVRSGSGDFTGGETGGSSESGGGAGARVPHLAVISDSREDWFHELIEIKRFSASSLTRLQATLVADVSLTCFLIESGQGAGEEFTVGVPAIGACCRLVCGCNRPIVVASVPFRCCHCGHSSKFCTCSRNLAETIHAGSISEGQCSGITSKRIGF